MPYEDELPRLFAASAAGCAVMAALKIASDRTLPAVDPSDKLAVELRKAMPVFAGVIIATLVAYLLRPLRDAMALKEKAR